MRKSCSLTNPNPSKANVSTQDPILSNHYALKEHDPDFLCDKYRDGCQH